MRENRNSKNKQQKAETLRNDRSKTGVARET
jgi:hypothetical protein